MFAAGGVGSGVGEAGPDGQVQVHAFPGVRRDWWRLHYADLGIMPFRFTAVAPEQDVVQVDAAGFAAGEAAPVSVAFAGGVAQRGRWLAATAADVEQVAVGVMQHGADCVAGDHLQRRRAER